MTQKRSITFVSLCHVSICMTVLIQVFQLYSFTDTWYIGAFMLECMYEVLAGIYI